MDSINKIIVDPRYRELFQTVKSIRNGVVYGGRLRFAHSLVINLLFRRNTPLSKRISSVLKAAKDHSFILGLYVILYKSVMLFLRKLTKKDKPIYEFIAGSLAASVVYGNLTSLVNHSIAHHITLYCFGRVLLGIGKLMAYKIARKVAELNKLDKKVLRTDIQNISWTFFASISWGFVMYMHRFYPSFLQHSLEASMIYIYDDNNFTDLKSLFGF